MSRSPSRHRSVALLAASLVAALGSAGAAQASTRSWGALSFSECALGPADAAIPVRGYCAELAAPENPADPASRKISLRIGWLPARGAEPRPDPLVFFAGGPGQSATEGIANVGPAFARIREQRHILLVDQRGTGGSNPLHCSWPKDLDLARVDAGGATKLAQDCLAAIGERADPRFYATHHAVHDIEAVRQAIGAPLLNLYGGSYGTRAAQEYLRRYPQAVRSVILDAVVPPELALGGEHAENLDAALAAIFARCSGESACQQRYGELLPRQYALRDRLRAQPMTIRFTDPLNHQRLLERFGEGHLATVVRMFAYAPESSALLPLLLDEADAGRPEPMLAHARLLAKSLGGAIAMGMHLSVSCSEDADRLQPRDEDARRLLGNQIIDLLKSQCAVWPHAPRPADFNAPISTDVPMLLLSGEFDPVTPPRYGEQVLAGKSRARHLVGKGQGHILINRGCMPRLAAQFLDQLDPAGLDASCLDVLGPTPFFLDFNGAAP
ncbi:MAG TPA: alpha/beta fold hydrolase [Arenimonas sp.]|nr:alpha/beta fold hydrolase [Arenimonas sp.]